MADPTLLSTLRGQLEEERARLTSQIASLEVGSDEAPAYDENFADSGQVAAEQGENKALLNQFEEQLEEFELDQPDEEVEPSAGLTPLPSGFEQLRVVGQDWAQGGMGVEDSWWTRLESAWPSHAEVDVLGGRGALWAALAVGLAQLGAVTLAAPAGET